MPGLWETLFGSSDKMKQVSRFSPGQSKLFNQMTERLNRQGMPQSIGQTPGYQAGMNYLMDLYGQSPQAFEKFKAPYMTQFKESTVPQLSEQFAGMGAGGMGSSSFNQAMAHAGSSLSEQLASMMEGYKGQMLPQLLGYSQAPMNEYSQQMMNMLGISPFENVMQQGSTGLLGNLLSGAGAGFGMGLGGPLGGALGSSLGSGFGNMFSKMGGGGGRKTDTLGQSLGFW